MYRAREPPSLVASYYLGGLSLSIALAQDSWTQSKIVCMSVGPVCFWCTGHLAVGMPYSKSKRNPPSGADRSPEAPARGRCPPRPAGQPAPSSPGPSTLLPGQPGRRQDGHHGVIEQRRSLNGRPPVLAGQTGQGQTDHLGLGGLVRTVARLAPRPTSVVRYSATPTGAAGSQGTPASPAQATN